MVDLGFMFDEGSKIYNHQNHCKNIFCPLLRPPFCYLRRIHWIYWVHWVYRCNGFYWNHWFHWRHRYAEWQQAMCICVLSFHMDITDGHMELFTPVDDPVIVAYVLLQ